jgi:predicted dehydrogenase
MNPPAELTRRAFLGKAATLTALGFAAPRLRAAAAARAARRASANGKIHLGLIGCGGMGQSNLRTCAKHPEVVVTAACDVWPDRRDHVVEQYKPTCKAYRDWREVLARPDVDAVIIATPPHWHALMGIEACKAGKDIYLQKPMTLHLGESLALRNAVRRHGVISQVGTQIHASENYRRVVEYVRSGNLGPIATVRTFCVMNQTPHGLGHSPASPLPEGFDWEMWVGPAPLRPFNKLIIQDAFNHSSWMDYGGGWTPGMAPHIIDLPIWALDLGYPTAIHSCGGRFVLRDDGDIYDNHEVLWHYPGLTLTWMCSLTNSFGFDFHGEPVPRRRLGIYFHGTNGTLFANYSMFKIVPEGDKLQDKPAPPATLPPSPGHEWEWLECVKSRQQPSCSVLYHVRVDVPIVLSLLALKLNRSLRFDPQRERLVGDAEAAQRAIPTYRKPWKFPKEYLKA